MKNFCTRCAEFSGPFTTSPGPKACPKTTRRNWGHPRMAGTASPGTHENGGNRHKR